MFETSNYRKDEDEATPAVQTLLVQGNPQPNSLHLIYAIKRVVDVFGLVNFVPDLGVPVSRSDKSAEFNCYPNFVVDL